MGAVARAPRSGSVAVLAVGAVALGVLLAAGLLWLHDSRLSLFAADSRAVVDRTPHSTAFQSRLLTPHAVALVARVASVPHERAYTWTLVALAVACGVLAVFVFRRWSGSERPALLYAAWLVAAVLLVQDESWLHLWDLADVALQTLAAYGAFAGARNGCMVALFLVALANRESALFIPFWFVIAAFRPLERNSKYDRGKGLLGISLMLGGLAAITATRALLFAGAHSPARQLSPWGNHVKLMHNLSDLALAIREGQVRNLTIYAVLLVVSLGCRAVYRRADRTTQNAIILVAGMACGVFAFGLVLETRSWMMAVPWLVFIVATARARRTAAAPS